MQVVQEQLELAVGLLLAKKADASLDKDILEGIAWIYKSGKRSNRLRKAELTGIAKALNFVLSGLKKLSLTSIAHLARLAASLASSYASLGSLEPDGSESEAKVQAKQNSLTLLYLAVTSEMQHLDQADDPRQIVSILALLSPTIADLALDTEQGPHPTSC